MISIVLPYAMLPGSCRSWELTKFFPRERGGATQIMQASLAAEPVEVIFTVRLPPPPEVATIVTAIGELTVVESGGATGMGLPAVTTGMFSFENN